MKREPPFVVLILLLCAFLYLFRLGSSGILYPSQEPRRILLAKDVLEKGHWIVPHLLGEPYVHKPPLLIWAIASTYRLSGHTDLFFSRLPSALCGILGVFITFVMAKRLFGERIALFSATILATSPLWIERSRMAEEDIILALWVLLAFFSFFLALEEGHKRYLWLFYLSCALGCLTKFISGLIFPVLGIGSFVLLNRSLKDLKGIKLPYGILVFCALVIPWYIYAYSIAGLPKGKTAFLEDTFRKFFPPADASKEPFYYYFLTTIPYFLPWSVLILAIPFYFLEHQRLKNKKISYVFCWLVPNFIFFSLAGAKRNEYILPLYPALSIIGALIWDHFLKEKGNKPFRFAVQLGLWIMALGNILLGLVLPLIPLLAKDLPQQGSSFSAYVFAPLFSLCGLLMLWGLKKKRPSLFLPLAISFSLLLFLSYHEYFLPKFRWYKIPHPFCDRAKAILGDTLPLLFEPEVERLYLQNEWNGKLGEIDPGELQRRLAQGQTLYLLTGRRGLEYLSRRGVPFEVLLQQDPFLKKGRSVALVLARGSKGSSALRP